MKKFNTTLIAALLTATTALASPGQMRGERHHPCPGIERLATRLNLTEAQKSQIRSIRQSHREENRSLIESFRAKRAEVRQLRERNDPRAESAKAELKGMREQIRSRHQQVHQEVLSVMTAEQRQQLEQLRSEHRHTR